MPYSSDHDGSSLADSTSRLHREFPLSSDSLSQQTEATSSAAPWRHRRVRDIERLARQLSPGRSLDGELILRSKHAHGHADYRIQRFTNTDDAGLQHQTSLRLLSDAGYARLQGPPEHTRRDTLLQSSLPYDTLRQEIENATTSPESNLHSLPVESIAARATGPVVTIPVLPATQYNEQSEKDFERSLEYVHVQRRILKYLEKYDIALDARTAYTWTCDSATGQRPEPLQALRLCYYMRSLGFDTFANIECFASPRSERKTTTLILSIANPNSETHDVARNHIYWAQNITTGEVYPKAYKLRRHGASDGSSVRRPLLAVNTGSSFNASEIMQQVDQQQSRSVQMRGGEASEHYRCSLSTRELEGLQEQQRGGLGQPGQWEAELVDEAHTSRPLFNTVPDAG